MSLLDDSKAIFYHPLDNSTEVLKSQAWTESTTALVSGKVSSALAAAVTPSFGAEKEFLSAGAASYIFVAALDSDKFVVVYQDTSAANHGKAKIGTVSGTDITFGAEKEFVAAQANYTHATALSATKFVVSYSDGGDGFKGTAKVGTVSGTDITFGTEAEFLSAGISSYNYIATIDASKFVVAYRDNADAGHGTARVGTISGTDITFGVESEFLSLADAEFVSVAAVLSPTKFVVAFRDDSNALHGTAKVGTVSGTTITFGAESEFLSETGADFVSIAALDASKFVVAYQDDSDLSHGTARVGSVSGTTITFGTAVEFLSAGAASSINTVGINSSRFIVAYRDAADAGAGTSRVGTVNGTDIVFGTEAEFGPVPTGEGPNGPQHISLAIVGSALIVAFRDGVDAGHGTAKVGTLPAGPASVTGVGAPYNSAAGAAKVAFVGWLKNPSA